MNESSLLIEGTFSEYVDDFKLFLIKLHLLYIYVINTMRIPKH